MKSREEIFEGHIDPQLAPIIDVLVDIRDILQADYEIRRNIFDSAESVSMVSTPYVNKVTEKERQPYLMAIGLDFRRRLMNPESMLTALDYLNRSICSPPLEKEELNEIIDSVYAEDIDGMEILSD